MEKGSKLYEIEVLADRLIPYTLILLLFLIIGEVFFSDNFHYYSYFVSIVDYLVIGVFALDLFFKYRHVRSIPRFLRTYFLEILALFPAFLIVRILEEILTVTGLESTVRFSQEALEISQQTGLGQTRLSYFARLIKPLARLPRFLAAFHFYEKPTHRHLTIKLVKNMNNTKQKMRSNKK